LEYVYTYKKRKSKSEKRKEKREKRKEKKRKEKVIFEVLRRWVKVCCYMDIYDNLENKEYIKNTKITRTITNN
jgi:hypothetical protein